MTHGNSAEKTFTPPAGLDQQYRGEFRRTSQVIRTTLESIIARLSPHGEHDFFETALFPWVSDVEREFPAIRSELDRLLEQREAIPNFQDISEAQRALTEGKQWKTFFLYAYGHKLEQNCARCPETTRLLQVIPGMKTAMFSILAPGKHIPEHRGPYKGVLRYHLGLRIPQPNTRCRIRVGNELRCWEEGKSLIFDDTYPHEVWNDTDSYRTVLFVDFVRPLRFPMSSINQLVLWAIARRPFVTEAVSRARNGGGAGEPGTGTSLEALTQ